MQRGRESLRLRECRRNLILKLRRAGSSELKDALERMNSRSFLPVRRRAAFFHPRRLATELPLATPRGAPTSLHDLLPAALDAAALAEVLKPPRRTQQQRDARLILIALDLRLAVSACERVYVLYAGSLPEVGRARDIEREPPRPNSLGLLLSEPPPVERRLQGLVEIRGAVPTEDDAVGICRFGPCSDRARNACRAADPEFPSYASDRMSACIRIREMKCAPRGVESAQGRALRQGNFRGPTRPPCKSQFSFRQVVSGTGRPSGSRPEGHVPGDSTGRERRAGRSVRLRRDNPGPLSGRSRDARRRCIQRQRH